LEFEAAKDAIKGSVASFDAPEPHDAFFAHRGTSDPFERFGDSQMEFPAQDDALVRAFKLRFFEACRQ
jgi:hypothetical protein